MLLIICATLFNGVLYMGVIEDPRLAKLLEKPNLRILTVVRDHMSGLLYSVPYLRAHYVTIFLMRKSCC